MQTEVKDRLWSPVQVSIAAYFGGPIAGGYFLGKNSQRLGLSKQAQRCYAAGILGTFIITLLLWLLPDEWTTHIRPAYIAIAVSSLFTSVAYAYQKPLLEGAPRFSYWWCFLLTISLAIIQLPIFLASWIILANILY